MKKYVIKKAILSLWFCFISLMLVSITFPYMEMTPHASFLMYDILALIIISAICFAMPTIAQFIVQLGLLIFELLVLNASISIYASSKNVFNWTMITLIKEAKISSGMAVIPLLPIIVCVCAISPYVITMIFLKTEKINLKKFYKSLLICSEAVVLTFTSLFAVDYKEAFVKKYDVNAYYSSDSFMYSTFNSSYASLQKFGYYGYYFEDLARRIAPSLAPAVREPSGNSYKYDYYTSILDSVAKDNNCLMVYAESFDIYAITKELTPVLYSLKNGVDLTDSGVLKFYGKSNEGGVVDFERKDFAYDYSSSRYIELDVDIYEGVEFDKVGLTLEKYKSSESTNVSEYKSLTGRYYSGDFALPKMLDDYTSNYVHGNMGEFYQRKSYMSTEIGFDNTRFLEDMDFAVGSKTDLNCLTMDSVTMKHYTSANTDFDFLPTNEKFLSYFMTITTHGNYAYSEFLDYNYKLVDAVANSNMAKDSEIFKLYNALQDNDLKKAVKEYFARVLDTEYAMCYIVDYLYQNNMLDKTIITLTGDHNAYSNNISVFKSNYVEKVLKKDPYEYGSVVEGFIYSTQLKSEYLNEYGVSRRVTHLTQSVDLVPTILTMLGREYTQDVYLGAPVINFLVSDDTKSNKNKVMFSYYYGFMEGDKLTSTDGEIVTSLNPNYIPTREEIEQFINDYNEFFAKSDYINRKIG